MPTTGRKTDSSVCKATVGESTWDIFANTPNAAKPWVYYFWTNSLTDRETIAAEVADMVRLGFGGILLVDSRGYWDDEHVHNPPSAISRRGLVHVFLEEVREIGNFWRIPFYGTTANCRRAGSYDPARLQFQHFG